MKNLFAALSLAVIFASGCSTTPAVVNPVRATAYPLVTIDPYTSAWSMTDNLYDSPVKHWTGKDFPMLGALKVDGTVYRFLGREEIEMLTVIPSGTQGAGWEGAYTTDKPADNWIKADFNDSKWKTAAAPWGMLEAEARTPWTTEHIWVRRVVNLEESLEGKTVYMDYSNDDDAVFYVNGIEVHSVTDCNKNALVKLPEEAVSSLKAGENLICAKCWNRGGNALIDFGLKLRVEKESALQQAATQTYAEVRPMQTVYGFTAGGVDLTLTFTAPMFLDDLDLLSRPVNYITYDVKANDGQTHDVDVYFEVSPRWALDFMWQESESTLGESEGMYVLKAGSVDQRILAKKGDDRRIDWGYVVFAAEKENTTAALGPGAELRNAFAAGESLQSEAKASGIDGQLALSRRLGNVKNASGKVLIAYDDVYSIQYFGENLRPYWNRKGDKTIEGQLKLALDEYPALMKKAAAFDRDMMAKAAKAGGEKYACLCALAYRQANAAHKVVEAPDGDVLWLSKENNSNGSIGTVDVTYPSAPLYLLYNPVLCEGLLNHIFDYSESGKWTKPFPAHDVGTYPLANGQTYGGDMPVEEGGNMLILTAAICHVEKSYEFAKKHWDVLTTWTEYLMQFGLDPQNQLCTDDFAGHFAHNANLSVKAILGIASYAKMAEKLGYADAAEKYMAAAKEMAAQWKEMAADGDHYRLTFDKEGTWSQKYNLVWDKMLGYNIFDPEIARTEIAYYLTVQNQYGLPLDSRKAYTKTDWIVWTATMAENPQDFQALIEPVYNFENESTDRVPMSDWIWTDKPEMRGFKARSVVGGYFIKMLSETL
ncbi:MAG: DUF4965 domain-containing protein [Bacteroidales bacterium]|nr:DUF4965 domain-containing protein [Bacteroidales bacterium]